MNTGKQEIVEIDAMDVAEWEHGQLTPQASDARLAALVKESAAAPPLPSVRKPMVPRAQTADPALVRATPAPIPSAPRPTGGPPRAAAPAPRPTPPAAPRPLALPPRPAAPSAAVVAARHTPIPVGLVASGTGEESAASIDASALTPLPAPLPAPPEPTPVLAPVAPVPVFAEPPPLTTEPALQAPLAEAAWSQQLAPAPAAYAPPPAAPELHALDERARRTDSLAAVAAGRSRKLAVLVGGGAAIVGAAVLAIALLSGGAPARPPVTASAPSPSAAPAPAPAPAPTPAPTPTPAPAPAAAAAVAVVAPAADFAPVAAPVAAPAKRARVAGKAKAKKLVLDYDHAATEAPAPAPSTDAALTQARAAYAAGNQRLFAGDADGAIHAYRNALAAYPGYVAGYRGLGLAYAQQGDTAKALQALRTYVAAVPKAKDVPLIQKRIARLAAH